MGFLGIDHHNASSTQAVAVGIVEGFVVGSGAVDGIVVVAALVVTVVVLVIFAVGLLAEVARRTLCFSSVVVGVLAKCTTRAVNTLSKM